MTIAVRVTEHALWRAAERWGRSVAADEIERDVSAAIAAGRLSGRRPGWHPATPQNQGASYVWTGDRRRLYVIRPTGTGFLVLTTYEETT